MKTVWLVVNGKRTISFEQFLTINSNLVPISDTWSDLWALIFYTGLSVGRLITLRYEDIGLNSLCLRERGRLKAMKLQLSSPSRALLHRRRERYPRDVFVFQSHSNRVKNQVGPVTVIAFNAALRRAGRVLPLRTVSSTSARNVAI
ncbi:hypothetical protein QFI91_14795 [Raoultella sp. WB_B2P2-3]|uniref:Tyr recombinase domain-containing protein n=1 Tax=Raoultella scottii TaxID=3040937 RepID=A0ABU8ZAA5_9ENTR